MAVALYSNLTFASFIFNILSVINTSVTAVKSDTRVLESNTKRTASFVSDLSTTGNLGRRLPRPIGVPLEPGSGHVTRGTLRRVVVIASPFPRFVMPLIILTCPPHFTSL
jgi:hypothetical protein